MYFDGKQEEKFHWFNKQTSELQEGEELSEEFNCQSRQNVDFCDDDDEQ